MRDFPGTNKSGIVTDFLLRLAMFTKHLWCLQVLVMFTIEIKLHLIPWNYIYSATQVAYDKTNATQQDGACWSNRGRCEKKEKTQLKDTSGQPATEVTRSLRAIKTTLILCLGIHTSPTFRLPPSRNFRAAARRSEVAGRKNPGACRFRCVRGFMWNCGLDMCPKSKG